MLSPSSLVEIWKPATSTTAVRAFDGSLQVIFHSHYMNKTVLQRKRYLDAGCICRIRYVLAVEFLKRSYSGAAAISVFYYR